MPALHMGFQSTPSMRRETLKKYPMLRVDPFQSTPSMRRETLELLKVVAGAYDISIHSLHAEGDNSPLHGSLQGSHISIHSLHAEGDLLLHELFNGRSEFQSTPSMRRETHRNSRLSSHHLYFNPLPPCGGRQQNYTTI